MKKLMILLLLISPVLVKAQSETKAATPLAAVNGKEPSYILDGKKIEKGGLGNVNPDDILEIQVIKDATQAALYDRDYANGVVLVTTKKFAIASYQEKFSLLSDDYESYLTGHGTDDVNIIYELDGKALPKDRDEAGTLFHLKKENLESVVFTQKEPEGSKIVARVVITTKK